MFSYCLSVNIYCLGRLDSVALLQSDSLARYVAGPITDDISVDGGAISTGDTGIQVVEGT